MAFRDDKNSDTQEETGLVRYGEEPPTQPKPSQPRPFASALIWCGFGAVALTSIAAIGVAMVAYGISRGISAKLSRSYLGALVAASMAGLILGWLWVQGNLGVVLQGGVVLCIALVVGALAAKKRANLTVDYAAAALATLAAIGLNWLVMSLVGEDFFAAVRSIIDTQVQAISEASGLEMAAQIRSVTWVIYLLWPFAYFVAAGLSVLAAHFAGWVARETPGTPPTWRAQAADAPTWAMVVLIGSIALMAFNFLFGPLSQAAATVGASALMAVRFVFLLEGYGVLMWWLQKYQAGCLIRFLVILLALQLEASFFVVSILGVVDFFANFRHLDRGEPKASAA